MAELDINSALASDLTTAMTDYSVPFEVTEAGDGSIEHGYINPDWAEDYGYYLNIPEFKTAVDAKALWTMGAGYEADEPTTMLLDSITGNGKDSFNSILKNLIKVKTISRDSFAEIIRDDDEMLINIKPLDPSSIRIVQNLKGRIIRYEQVTKKKEVIKKYEPEQIFHLSHDRMADSICGTRIIDSLKWLILARNEAMADWKRVLHRTIDPLWIFHLDTDDETEIAAFKAKNDAARASGENMYVPKGVVVPELVASSPNATMNPLQWIDRLGDYFFQSVMTPQILFGNAKGFTDASGKIVYLAFEQSVKTEQIYIEEAVQTQLNLTIELTFPASLQNDMITEKEKDPNSMEQAVEPNDQMVEMEGKK